ncbi:kunitz-type trypsin inhibitor-like 2 protein [Medicago truncatula]|uniref:kunitz-type trypsin inhibitor-like 2 protein n=1 Tax=Medicago truncatula TaxID=3880 RepID=UPI0019673320|nr:kunitz-type trypsin inhibitor-like 2 protein [Medicago truncatula]
MKLVLSLTLSFLIFAFITTLSLAFSNDEQVLDTNGNPIVPGGEYYIFPATQDPYKGGLRLAKTGDSKCPVTILQNENITGLPVKFTIQGISNDIIMTGTELKIEFTKKPNCVKSSQWLMFFDYDASSFNVIIGVDEYIPEIIIIDGTFYIQKYGNAYKLGFCNDDMGEQNCLDIMRWNNSKDGGSRLRLILKAEQEVQDPYPVVFVDAPSFESGILMNVSL